MEDEAGRMLRIYWRMVGAALRNSLIERHSLVVRVAGLVMSDVPALLALVVIIVRFGSIGDWGAAEISFVFAFSHVAYGLRNFVFHGFRTVPHLIVRGEIDMLLLRPLPVGLQIAGGRFTLEGATSHLLVGIMMAVTVGSIWPIQWTAGRIALLVPALVSSTLAQGGITIAISSVAFSTISNRGLENLYSGVREFTWYPLTIFHRPVQVLLFTAIPVAFGGFMQSGLFVSHPFFDQIGWVVWSAVLLSGPLIYAAGFFLWRLGLRKYSSTGS